MSVVTMALRLLGAAPLVSAGLNASAHPMPMNNNAQLLVAQLPAKSHRVVKPEGTLRGAGAVLAGASTALAWGVAPAVSGVATLASASIVASSESPFWNATDPRERRTQRIAWWRLMGLAAALTAAGVATSRRQHLAHVDHL